MERIATDNVILKAQVHGLEQAVTLKKKRRKRGTGLMKNIRTITNSKAQFWLLARIKSATDILNEQERNKKDEAFRKAEAKF
jgi:hypothetical protein